MRSRGFSQPSARLLAQLAQGSPAPVSFAGDRAEFVLVEITAVNTAAAVVSYSWREAVPADTAAVTLDGRVSLTKTITSDQIGEAHVIGSTDAGLQPGDNAVLMGPFVRGSEDPFMLIVQSSSGDSGVIYRVKSSAVVTGFAPGSPTGKGGGGRWDYVVEVGTRATGSFVAFLDGASNAIEYPAQNLFEQGAGGAADAIGPLADDANVVIEPVHSGRLVKGDLSLQVGTPTVEFDVPCIVSISCGESGGGAT